MARRISTGNLGTSTRDGPQLNRLIESEAALHIFLSNQHRLSMLGRFMDHHAGLIIGDYQRVSTALGLIPAYCALCPVIVLNRLALMVDVKAPRRRAGIVCQGNLANQTHGGVEAPVTYTSSTTSASSPVYSRLIPLMSLSYLGGTLP